MKRILSSLLIVFLIKPIPVYSIDTDINIPKALSLASSEKYEESLIILAPCSKATSPTEYLNLEDCLYYGEEISKKAIRPLLNRYRNDKHLKITYGGLHNWLDKMGLKADMPPNAFGDADYEYINNYIRTLIDLFPTSKHKDIYDYVVIERGVNEIKPVQKWMDLLLAYRTNHPTGYYIFNATSDLANAYDDLWEILTPDPKYGYDPAYSDFSSGDKETDRKNSEIYRREALRLYKSLKNYEIPKGKRNEYIFKESKVRLKTLKERKPSHSFYILND